MQSIKITPSFYLAEVIVVTSQHCVMSFKLVTRCSKFYYLPVCYLIVPPLIFAKIKPEFLLSHYYAFYFLFVIVC